VVVAAEKSPILCEALLSTHAMWFLELVWVARTKFPPRPCQLLLSTRQLTSWEKIFTVTNVFSLMTAADTWDLPSLTAHLPKMADHCRRRDIYIVMERPNWITRQIERLSYVKGSHEAELQEDRNAVSASLIQPDVLAGA